MRNSPKFKLEEGEKDNVEVKPPIEIGIRETHSFKLGAHGNTNVAGCLYFSKIGILVSLVNDYRIYFWDIEKRTLVRKFKTDKITTYGLTMIKYGRNFGEFVVSVGLSVDAEKNRGTGRLLLVRFEFDPVSRKIGKIDVSPIFVCESVLADVKKTKGDVIAAVDSGMKNINQMGVANTAFQHFFSILSRPKTLFLVSVTKKILLAKVRTFHEKIILSKSCENSIFVTSEPIFRGNEVVQVFSRVSWKLGDHGDVSRERERGGRKFEMKEMKEIGKVKSKGDLTHSVFEVQTTTKVCNSSSDESLILLQLLVTKIYFMDTKSGSIFKTVSIELPVDRTRLDANLRNIRIPGAYFLLERYFLSFSYVDQCLSIHDVKDGSLQFAKFYAGDEFFTQSLDRRKYTNPCLLVERGNGKMLKFFGKSDTSVYVHEFQVVENYRKCVCCGKLEEPGSTFKKCSNCYSEMKKKVLYCSKKCQIEDWKNHKKVCRKK